MERNIFKTPSMTLETHLLHWLKILYYELESIKHNTNPKSYEAISVFTGEIVKWWNLVINF